MNFFFFYSERRFIYQRHQYIRQFWTQKDGRLVNRDDKNITYIPPNDQIWNLPARIGYVENNEGRVNNQGVESLWGDCRFIPADRGS